MRKASVAFIALTLIGFGVASCGRFQREQRAAWRDEAEAACLSRGEVRQSAYMSFRSQPINGPGTCGMNRPLRVNAFAGGDVAVTSTQTLACPIVATTDRFLAEVVQPAAMGNFGSQVIEMRAGSYSCRAMNNGSGTSRRSEHSYGNALDIFSFRFSDGREVTIRHGWNGSPQERDFLREVFTGACRIYRTVLGPGADMFHYDHLHVDLARHAGGRQVCRPIIKHTPRRDLPPPDPAAREVIAMSPRPADSQRLGAAPMTPRFEPSQEQMREPMREPRRQQMLAAYAHEPQVGGPIRLPGSVVGPEELVLGDIQGELIDPDNDPFALEDPKPRAPRSGAALTPRPAPPPAQAYSSSPPPAPPPVPRREWPPRF